MNEFYPQQTSYIQQLPVCTKLYQKNGEALLVCKAFNGRVVMQWLAETVLAASQQNIFTARDDRIATVALCMFLG